MDLSFSLSQEEEIKNCLHKNGVVVIKDIFTSDELEKIYVDIEKLINDSTSHGFKFKDPSTYDNANQCVNAHGVLGKTALFTKGLMENRLHPNIIKAYNIAYNNEPIICQHDRLALMRQTIGPNYEDWSKYRTPFKKPGIHLDLDPNGYYNKNYYKKCLKKIEELEYKNLRDFIHENNIKNKLMGTHYQGVVNLFDNEIEDGGFQCIIGGHLQLEEWYNQAQMYLPLASENGRYNFDEKNSADKMFSNPVRIPCPKGSIIIFDATLPHGTKPNYSQNNRMIQFIRYIPKKCFSNSAYKRRKKCLEKIFKNIDFQPTDEQNLYL